MEIAVVGGSFNPPTKAHEAIARACLDRPEFDEVWMMPSGERKDKRYGVSNEDRLRMLELVKQEVFAENKRLVISKFELDLPIPTQTWRTVQALRRLRGNDTFRFVFGADAFENMKLWERGEELQRTLPMLLVTRDDYPVPVSSNIQTLPIDSRDEISSTKVRRSVEAGTPINNWVCQAVERYITGHRLYNLPHSYL